MDLKQTVRSSHRGLRLSTILGSVAVLGLLVTPVASAAPGQNSWEPIEGRAFDGCTGEYFDNSGTLHIVETSSGPFHFNVHLEGIGESTGSRYVYDTVDNEFFHQAADGSYTIDQVLNFRVVSQGNLPNSWLTVHVHLVVAADGSVTGTNDFSFGCHGN